MGTPAATAPMGSSTAASSQASETYEDDGMDILNEDDFNDGADAE